MPTTRPRYTVTDTGQLRTYLDAAERQWPEVRSRRELLLRLTQAGHEALDVEQSGARAAQRRETQLAALQSLRRTVDWGAIRDDQAWR